MSRSTTDTQTHRAKSARPPRGPAAPELYLILPKPTASAPVPMDRVAAMLAEGPIASCLVPSALAEALQGEPLNRLIGVIQASGAAALIADDPRLALAHGADGVHLVAGAETDPAAFDTARALLGADAIIGVYATTRHQAMVFGERGADYIALPYPDAAVQDDDEPIIAWWSQLFEVPCVGMAATNPADAAQMARWGADFVAIAPEALGDWTERGTLAAFRAAISAPSDVRAAP